MQILHLTLKKKWFDAIASGKKTIEYRENKPYWHSRLIDKNGDFKHFDVVIFKNGYSKEAPVLTRKCDRIILNKQLDVFEIHLK